MPDHQHKYLRITVEKADGATMVFDLTDPESEPVFLLRGQDVFAPVALAAYAQALRSDNAHEQADHVLEHIVEMQRWPVQKRPD